MPIWTVSFCQLLPPPAAKLRRLQAIQLPRAPSAKGARAASTAPGGWAGLRPGAGGALLCNGARTRLLSGCDLCLLFFLVIYCGRLLGAPSPSWKWQQNMLLLPPLPFMYLLASLALTCCLHAVISWSRLGLSEPGPPTPNPSLHP